MKKKKIMIVDDNQQVRKLFKDLLRISGFEVLSYAEPPTCIQNIEVDLIITDFDFNIPETNGIKFAQEVKKHYPHMPIIMVSADLPLLPEDSPVNVCFEKPITDLVGFVNAIKQLTQTT